MHARFTSLARSLVCLAVLVGVSSTVQVQASPAKNPDKIHKTFQLGSTPTVELANIRGAMTIRVAPGKTVSLDAVKLHGTPAERALQRIEIEEQPGHLRVRVRCELEERRCGRVAVRFDLRVPARTLLRCRTVNGPIKVTDVSGAEVSLKSVNGAIHYSSTKANPARLELDTVNGRVLARLGGAKRIRTRSVNGAIRLELLRASRQVSATSVSGPVHLLLARNLGAELQLSTLSGKLSSSLPMASQRRHRRSLGGTIGDGAMPIRANTVSGDVIVAHLD